MTESEELLYLKDLLEKRNSNKVLHEAERLEKRYSELKKHQNLVDTLIVKIKALWMLGRLEESLEEIENCEEILPLLEHPEEVKKRETRLLKDKGAIYFYKLDLKRGLEYTQRSLVLAEEINDKVAMMNATNNISFYFSNMGDLKNALIYGQQAITLAEEIGDKYWIAATLDNIIPVYVWKGDLDKAEDIAQRSLALSEEYNYVFTQASSTNWLGAIYWELGDLKKALNYLKQSYTLFEKIAFIPGVIGGIFEIFSLNIEIEDFEQAQIYLQRLQQITENEKITYPRIYYHLAKAMYLKTSPRMTDKAKAQNMLLKLAEEEFSEDEYSSIKLKIIVMLNLCESLLDEAKTYENKTVFKEALTVAQEVYSLAQKMKSFLLIVKLLLLQAKFSTAEGDLATSLTFLKQAKLIAVDKGLVTLVAQADAEKNELEIQYKKWEQLILNNAPFSTMLNKSKLIEYLMEAKKVRDFYQVR